MVKVIQEKTAMAGWIYQFRRDRESVKLRMGRKSKWPTQKTKEEDEKGVKAHKFK